MAYTNAALTTVPARSYQVIPGGAATFSNDLFSSFIDYTDRKATTTKGYLSCIRQFAHWMADNGVTQPTRQDIKAYRDHLAGSGLAVGTQAQYLRAVRHFFKWTAAEGLYPDIGDNIHGAKIRHDIHKKDALEREAADQVLRSIDHNTEAGRRLYAMYLLCVSCGLRTIEIHRADVGDIKTVGKYTLIYVQGKGHDDKDAPIVLLPEVKAAIDEYLEIRSEKVTKKSPLFTSTSNRSKGGRIAPTTISTMLKGLLLYNGIDSDRITAHSLRHTSGTAAFRAGIDLYGVQHLQRHQDPATTEIYIHDEKHLEAEARGRRLIYDYLFGGGNLHPVMPELEAEIMTLTQEEQQQLLAEIRARKGASK